VEKNLEKLDEAPHSKLCGIKGRVLLIPPLLDPLPQGERKKR